MVTTPASAKATVTGGCDNILPRQVSMLSAAVLKYLLILQQVRYDLLERIVLFHELMQSAHLGWHQHRIADPGLAKDLTNRGIFLALALEKGNLLFRKLRSLHSLQSNDQDNRLSLRNDTQ